MANLQKFFPGLGKGMPPTLSSAVPGVLTSASKTVGKVQTTPPVNQSLVQPSGGTGAGTPAKCNFKLGEHNIEYAIRSDCVETEISKQLLQVSPVSVMKNGTLNTFTGTRVSESDSYIAYALKKKPDGGIRIINKVSVKAAILEGHKEHVSSVVFSPVQPEMLASVAPDGRCIIWELKDDSGVVLYRKTVQLIAPTDDGDGPFHCIAWHPKRAGSFAVARGTSVVVCDITQELWTKNIAMPDGIPLEEASCYTLPCASGKINDIKFSANGEELCTCSEDGAVRFFSMENLRAVGSGTLPTRVFSPFDGTSVNALALSYHPSGVLQRVIVSSGRQNELFAVLDSNGNRCQQLLFTGKGGMNVDMRWTLDPSTQYIIATNSDSNDIMMLSLVDTGFESLVQFKVENPIVCFSLRQVGKNVEMYCMETKAIKKLSFEPKECVQQGILSGPAGSQSAAPALTRTGSGLVTPKDLLRAPPTSVNGEAGKVASPVAAPTSTGKEPAQAVPADLDALFKQHMDALAERLEERAKRRAEEDKERQKLLLQALAKSMMSIPTTVTAAVEEKLQSQEFINKISARVADNLRGSLKKDIGSVKDLAPELGKALQASLAKEQKNILDTLSANTSRQMSNAFRTAFEDNIIPAFDAGCQQVVASIKGGALEAAEVAQHVSQVPATGQNAQPVQGGFHSTAPQQVDHGRIKIETEILKHHQITPHLMNRNYEQAFYIALCANNLEVPIATCRQIDRVGFFSISPPPVSQGILLPLLQQLSVDLENEVDLKILWLNNIASVLDPSDPTIVDHAAGYLTALRENLKSLAPRFHADEWNPTAIAYRELVDRLG